MSFARTEITEEERKGTKAGERQETEDEQEYEDGAQCSVNHWTFIAVN